MIISCEECNSSFNVGDSLIKDTGSKVRCSKCDSVFVAFPISTEDELTLDFEDPMLGEDDDLGLDDLDSGFSAVLDDDEEDGTLARPSVTGELELDLNDFDNRLDAESELDSADGFEETEGEPEFDLPDLDFEEEDISALEDQSTEQVEDMGLGGSDELDLSDLESFIDDESDLEKIAETDLEESSLDLELDEQGVEEIAEAGLEMQAADETDLLDLDLDFEEASASEELSAAESDDLNLELDLETDTFAESDDLDLDLDLGLETDTAAGSEKSPTDGLDLSDLADILEDEEAPAAQATADDSALGVDMDLDLQLDDGAPTADTVAGSQGDDELDFSDLEQMLESDETPSAGTTNSINAEELDLQLDFDEPSTAGADADAAVNTIAEDEDSSFLDIEQLLEDGDGEGSTPLEDAGGPSNETTLMPLEMQAALEDASKGADAELELDFDLESELQAKEDEDLFDTSESTDHQPEQNLMASDEVDFLEEAVMADTEFKDTAGTNVVDVDEFTSDALEETDKPDGATYVLPASEPEMSATAATAATAATEFMEQASVVHKPPKTRSKKPLLVLVLLILLAIGATIIPNMLGIKIPYISDIKIPYLSDIKIPYLSDWLKPEPTDIAGNLKIIPVGNTINGKFVVNSKSGQLFVIRGRIENEYDHPRSYIKITGKLIQKGNKIAKTATVYCGNMLSNSDLGAMDITAINKKLSNRSGKKRSNIKVKTGNRLPFMIVFDKLPRNLDEYTVEVAGSSI